MDETPNLDAFRRELVDIARGLSLISRTYRMRKDYADGNTELAAFEAYHIFNSGLEKIIFCGTENELPKAD